MANALVRVRAGIGHAENADVSEPKTFDILTTAELNAKLQHSYAQSLAAEGRPFEAVFDEIEESLT